MKMTLLIIHGGPLEYSTQHLSVFMSISVYV